MRNADNTRLGPVQKSVLAIFIILTILAVITSIRQTAPEEPVPLQYLLVINISKALVATLIYGILAHFAIAIHSRLRKK